MKKILLIDGNSIINRAFYGVRALSTADGRPTNAIYGTVTIIQRQLDRLSPDCAVAAFDLKEPTFRHKFDANYKANRHGMPDELAAQMDGAKEVLSAFGVTCVSKPGYEADDIIGTYARAGEAAGAEVYILTGDRDSLQLIDDRVSVLLASTGDTADTGRKEFYGKYGVQPEQYVFVKALMGDSSDNIPGVRGIGEKTAFSLIAEYGDLDRLYSALENGSAKLSPSVASKLADGKKSAYDSLFLATIDTSVPELPELTEYHGENREKLLELFTGFEFGSLIKRMGLDTEKTEPVAATEKAFDGSASSLLCDGGRFYWSDGKSAFIHPENEKPDVSKAKDLCVYDIKTLCHVLGDIYADDVMLMGYIASPGDNDYSVPRLASRVLGTILDGTPAQSALWLCRLRDALQKKLLDEGQYKLYHELELPLAKLLCGMEKRGFRVDMERLDEFSQKLDGMISDLQQRVFLRAGHEFNINSPKQLATVLFDEMGLPSPKKVSTAADVLAKLARFDPVVDDILEYRKAAKLKSTYCDGLRKVADENGIVRTSFNQTVTATGRLSSTEPNLQNIPVRTELGREMRKFFVPREKGRVLIDADYSQIELRILAAVAGDENMISAFKSGKDIHASTASQVFGVPLDSVTAEQRKRAKAVNFGIVYGIGDYSLSEDLHIPIKTAAEYIKSYLETYPAIEAYLKTAVENAYRDGYVTTLFGRRRYIPELKSQKKPERSFGERVAMNSPIQGTAADVIKLAMINVQKALDDEGLDAFLILQVHDELILDCAEKDAAAAADVLKREMENAVSLPVPLTVDIGVGECWYDCK